MSGDAEPYKPPVSDTASDPITARRVITAQFKWWKVALIGTVLWLVVTIGGWSLISEVLFAERVRSHPGLDARVSYAIGRSTLPAILVIWIGAYVLELFARARIALWRAVTRLLARSPAP